MNYELIEECKSGNFNRGSTILKVKYYILPEVINQHLPVKDRVKQIELN